MFSTGKQQATLARLATSAILIIFLNHLQDVEAIVGGSKAVSGQWPYFAWLDNKGETCGAVIVDERLVVTLASCVPGRDQNKIRHVSIRVGSVERNGRANRIKHRIDKACTPTDYGWKKGNFMQMEDNFALLRLAKPLTFDNITNKANFDGEHTWNSTQWDRCHVIGAGLDIRRRWSLDLMYSQIDFHQCIGLATPSIFCFHHRGPIAGSCCRGDSGGPIVCEKEEKSWLIGLVSGVAHECRPYSASVGLMEGLPIKRFLDTTFNDCMKWLNSK